MNKPQETFWQASKLWNLERLYSDLSYAKGRKLTRTEKEYLRGLLLGLGPQEIAQEVNKVAGGVRVALTSLYRYVEALCNKPDNQVNSQNITLVLEEAGYKFPLSRQLQRRVVISCCFQLARPLSRQVFEALTAAGHVVYMSEDSYSLATQASDRLKVELEQCDYCLVFLSEQSTPNERETQVLDWVRKLRSTREEPKPTALAIRVGASSTESFNDSLCSSLEGILQRRWYPSPDQYLTLVLELLGLIAMGNSVIEQLSIEQLPDWFLNKPL